MNSRERILKNIRQSLGRGEPLTPTMRGMLEQRLAQPSAHIKPALTLERIAQFVAKLGASGASVARVETSASLSDALDAFASEHALPHRCVASRHPLLDSCAWPSGWDVTRGATQGDDSLSVTVPFGAVAETGTLAFVSGPASPTTLNFLPDNHIAVLREDDVVPNLEDVFARLRTEHPGMPRTLNLISGPSKTADVEQTIVIGAHGPRRLHVILIAG